MKIIAKWTTAVFVALITCYLATGLLDVCESHVQMWKFFVAPAAALIAAGAVFATANFSSAVRTFGIIIVAAFVGQVIGYKWPVICF